MLCREREHIVVASCVVDIEGDDGRAPGAPPFPIQSERLGEKGSGRGSVFAGRRCHAEGVRLQGSVSLVARSRGETRFARRASATVPGQVSWPRGSEFAERRARRSGARRSRSYKDVRLQSTLSASSSASARASAAVSPSSSPRAKDGRSASAGTNRPQRVTHGRLLFRGEPA